MPEVSPPVLVVTAISEELEPILRHFDRLDEDRVRQVRVYRSSACRAPLVLASTGDGPIRAERHALDLCQAIRPTALLGIGIAGALSSSLSPRDLLAAARVRNGAGEMLSADSVLLSLATGAGALPGTVVTVRAPLVAAAQKASLAAELPAAERAAADMESAAWGRAAAACEVPFLAVRAIADTAGDELPSYLAQCVGSDGAIRRTAVILRALARPSSIPQLLHWKRRTTECGERLAAFLWDFFDCDRW